MILATVASLRCDPSQIYVTGLSAGGAMAAAMLACYPEVFAGGSIVAGLPYGAAAGLPEALSAMFGARTSCASELGDRIRNAAPATPRQPRVIIWHGDADHTVNPSNAREIVKQWTSAHGVTETADHVDRPAGRTRSRWLSPKTGAVVIECNLVHGMGHGTPLSAQGPEGLGTPGPFMLEVGVSGALETAAFWGLDRSGAGTTAGASTSEPRPRRPPQSAASASALGDQVMASLGERLPPEVGRVIERALKAAGLRR
jgi:poly(3-hydroxybutyrate) depolymerase